jgi:hypothetical protein
MPFRECAACEWLSGKAVSALANPLSLLTAFLF